MKKKTTTDRFKRKIIIIDQNVVYTLRPIEKRAFKSLENDQNFEWQKHVHKIMRIFSFVVIYTSLFLSNECR